MGSTARTHGSRAPSGRGRSRDRQLVQSGPTTGERSIMTMTKVEYDTSRAAIEQTWPKAEYPAMTGVMLAELDAEYKARASARALASQGKAPDPASIREAPETFEERVRAGQARDDDFEEMTLRQYER